MINYIKDGEQYKGDPNKRKKPELVKAGMALSFLGLFILMVTAYLYTTEGRENGPIAGLMFGFMFLVIGLILWGTNYNQQQHQQQVKEQKENESN